MPWWEIAACILVQLLAAALGWRAARAGRRMFLTVFAASFVLLALGLVVRDSWWLLRALPLTDLLVWGDPSPLAAGLLAGLVAAGGTQPRWRRWGAAALLSLVAGWCSWGQLLRPPPVTEVAWDDIACLQTTESTCAPAAAATLLGLHGIAADEGTLARWCCTTAAGTSRWGLWRGLSLATAGTPWRVVASDPPVEEVLGHGPAVVSVALRPEADAREPRYRGKWGWVLGQPHAVVYLGPGSSPGKVRIADPKAGIEEWNEAALRDLWNRQVFRLEAR